MYIFVQFLKTMKGKILVILSAFIIVSCKTNPNAKNDLNYLQNIEKVAIESSARNSENTIQKGISWLFLSQQRYGCCKTF